MKTFGQGQRTVRVTASKLSMFHGRDRNKPLVVELLRGDLVSIRPLKTRRQQVYSVLDIYDWMVRTSAEKQRNERRQKRRTK